MTKQPIKKKKMLLFGVLLLFFCFPSEGRSDIYMYIDGNGVLHFTNVPTSSKYRIYLKERPPSTFKPRTINQYDPIIVKAAENHNLSFSLLKAIIKVESDFNPRAVSKKGAKGLMQLMPENIRIMKIKNPFDPRENIMGGARYFRRLLDRFDGKIQLSLAAYNAGPNQVERYNRIPPFKETEAYIKKVMKYYYAFKKG